LALDKDSQIIGYEFVHMGKFMEAIKKGVPADEALKSVTGHLRPHKAGAGYQLNPLTHVNNKEETSYD
jgi:hypothetical protein